MNDDFIESVTISLSDSFNTLHKSGLAFDS